MAREGDKWRVVRGDCLWNIAKAVYGDPYRWTSIADANGIAHRGGYPLIYPGQLLILPNITAQSVPAPQPAPPSYNSAIAFQWFALDAGTTRSMFATWTYPNANPAFRQYQVKWEYNTGAGGWRIGSDSSTTNSQSSYSAPDNAKQVRITVTPKGDNWSGSGTSRSYDYANNPPDIPPMPTFEVTNLNKLKVTLNNIPEDINATQIEIAVYQDNTYKYKTATVNINAETRYASFETDVEPGHSYKVRCRGVRGTIYGGWSDYTNIEYSVPVAPESIAELRSETVSEGQSKQYAVFIEWPEVPSAVNYLVEWTTNIEYFDKGEVSSKTTEEGKGPRLLLTGLDLGYEYFFRVASLNNKGQSLDYTPIKSVTLGTKPSAPTTYSNVTSCVMGEDLNLYWVHNSTDGSYERYARLNLIITDSAHPELQPMEIIKVIPNEKPEEDKNKTSVYTINTNDPEWATIGEGYVIKWKVQTAGITSEYSDWSTEREAIVYAKPEVAIDIQNNSGQSVEEINSFPFYVVVNSSPAAQTPISYYIEILANEAYQTVDDVGKVKMVNSGDKVYQKYYDPQINPWKFMLEMTPAIIDLENDISYTIRITVSMNSGLTAMAEERFTVSFEDLYYDVTGDVIINSETLEASIHPYCNEFYEEDGTIKPKLVENCTLSVYRKEYDGTFTEIATNIENQDNLYVTDPHPALDYARYRVVARTTDTGAISYGDLESVAVNEPSAVIQWAEEWSAFQVDESGDGFVEPAWSGSMIKIPYNISISESKNIDVSLIEYAGREHPVSYYGTQLGETSSWSMEIPKDDKETIYALRRLSRWTGDVYVREPYGTGYWANISVSISLKYGAVTVPVNISVTRVEGGM